MGTNTINSSSLFVNPTFLSGFSSILDMSGSLNMYNYSADENQADLKALKRDWFIVGKDISNSIKKHEQQTVQW